MGKKEEPQVDTLSIVRLWDENPDPVLRLDEAGGILAANRAALNLPGLLDSRKKALAPALKEALSARAGPSVVCALGDRSFAFRIVTSEEPSCVNLYGMDVTEQQVVHKRAVELAKFPGENPNPVLRIAMDGKVLYANEAAQATWGLVIGFDEPVLATSLFRAIQEVIELGARRDVEFDTGGMVLSFVMTHVAAESYINLYGRDITERRRVEHALRDSQELLRVVIDSVPAVINVKDRNGLFLLANPAQSSFYGLTPDDMVGKSIEEITDADYAEVTNERDRKVIETGEPMLHFDDPSLDAEGRSTTWYSTKVPLLGADRQVKAVVTVSIDITERTLIEAALRQSEERYALAMRGSNEGLWDWDLRTDEVFISPYIARLLGRPEQEQRIGRAEWEAAIHPEDEAPSAQAVEAHLRGVTEFYTAEYRVMGPDGAYLWVRDRGLSLRDGGGQLYRMAGSLGDITERKQAEIELYRAKQEAEAATRTKSQFLANMSHELRTPLNAIIGFTRLVMRRAKDTLPERQLDNLEKILISSNHLLSLINAVLDLSKIEAGQMEIRSVVVDLTALIEECIRTIEPSIDEKSLAIGLEIEPDLPTLVADPEKVRQILMNLLSNAVKFTDQGRIVVSAGRQGEGVSVAVTDSGLGIPEDQESRIFEQFHQVDSSSTRQHGGTGLGLSISRTLARLMGGDITLQSTVSVGSRFDLWLPLESAPFMPIGGPTRTQRWRRTLGGAKWKFRRAGKKLADDGGL